MKIASLHSGETAYEYINKQHQKTVVCLHGGTIPCWSFDAIVEKLCEIDCNIVRYDMYGRGESQSPEGAYDRAFYLTQLVELIQFLKIETIDTLVGSSFGGALALHFACKAPERARKIALISPAINWSRNNKLIHLLKMPLLGRIAYELLVRKRISARAHRYTNTRPSEVRKKYSEKVQQQFDYNNHNFWNTLYKQLTSNALSTYITECEKLGQINTCYSSDLGRRRYRSDP